MWALNYRADLEIGSAKNISLLPEFLSSPTYTKESQSGTILSFFLMLRKIKVD